MQPASLPSASSLGPWYWYFLYSRAGAGLVWPCIPRHARRNRTGPGGCRPHDHSRDILGAYSLLGKQASDPLEATANNFLLSLPLALIVSLVFWEEIHVSGAGIALATTSGAIGIRCNPGRYCAGSGATFSAFHHQVNDTNGPLPGLKKAARGAAFFYFGTTLS